MNTDLTVVSNRTAVALPGADSSKVYVKFRETADTIERRIQSTALTYPRVLLISQTERQPGTRKGSRRIVVSVKESDRVTVVPNESGIGGKADGEATVAMSINLPTAPGYGTTFTAAKIKTLAADMWDAFQQNIDAIIAGEK